MSEHVFADPDALDIALATKIADILTDAIAKRGAASLVVSGGSTPKGLFKRLATSALDWQHVSIMLADERWVPTDHDDSNERMVKELLLTDKATAATFVSLVPKYLNTTENLQAVSDALAAFDQFDLVILGMGGDSHTASLFPCCAEIDDGLSTEDAVLMTHPKTAPHGRVSMSRSRLLQSANGLVHIVGEDKLDVLKQAQSSPTSRSAPISAFVSPRGNFDVWYAPKV